MQIHPKPTPSRQTRQINKPANANAANKARQANTASKASANQGKTETQPQTQPALESDRLNRRFTPDESSLVGATLTLVDEAEKLLPLLDSNKDKRLSLAELTQPALHHQHDGHEETHPAHHEDPKASFSRRVLQNKLTQHYALIDPKGDGIDEGDLAALRAGAWTLSPTARTLSAVPIREPELVDRLMLEIPAPRVAYSLSSESSRQHVFEGRNAAAQGTERSTSRKIEAAVSRLNLGDRSVELIMPQDPAQREGLPIPEDLARAAASLPEALQKHLKRFELNPVSYHFETGNGAHGRTADMTAGPDGLITVYPHKREFRDLYRTLVHELGHQLSFVQMGSADGKGPQWERWHQAMAADSLSPSNYARDNASGPGIEDFAESVSAWVLTRGQPEHAEWRALMPARFAILDQLLK